MNNCYHQECIEQVALVRVCNSNRKIIELYRYRILGQCLATMAYVYAACAIRVTIFSTGGKFELKFKKLHALTLAARSYALLREG